MRPEENCCSEREGAPNFSVSCRLCSSVCWMVDWSGRTTLRTFIRRLAPAHMLTCSALALLPLPTLAFLAPALLVGIQKFAKETK
ncbi:hypothetical protein CDAR_67311 [Caerostris darwini]|uniref:Uncharacterized protein n=1 Tax=Caerostris darwini TaxID=1538125 RepID=A0AAV4S6J1_9ARAC|nr:hypothetical protein CDAR_67311 [Caerostris darwini]